MAKSNQYRLALRSQEDWDAYLMRESGLPGPRANLELVQAAADEGDESQFRRWLALDPTEAPTNSPQVFLVVCGIVGLGRLLAEGRTDQLATLRGFASDERWRVREAVCMALQRWGDVDMDSLLAEMKLWSQGNLLERRAVAAALCEPRLLKQPEHAAAVLDLLDRITASLAGEAGRKSDDFRVLRQALGYCWSVAVVALPEQGKPMMQRWLASGDPDVRWIMRENLKKNRLARMDPAWVANLTS